MWDLPGSGIEPVPPALAGEFFTTEPPGKSRRAILMTYFLKIDKIITQNIALDTILYSSSQVFFCFFFFQATLLFEMSGVKDMVVLLCLRGGGDGGLLAVFCPSFLPPSSQR